MLSRRAANQRLFDSLPFPVYERYEECSTVRGSWTPRWTPVSSPVCRHVDRGASAELLLRVRHTRLYPRLQSRWSTRARHRRSTALTTSCRVSTVGGFPFSPSRKRLSSIARRRPASTRTSWRMLESRPGRVPVRCDLLSLFHDAVDRLGGPDSEYAIVVVGLHDPEPLMGRGPEMSRRGGGFESRAL